MKMKKTMVILLLLAVAWVLIPAQTTDALEQDEISASSGAIAQANPRPPRQPAPVQPALRQPATRQPPPASEQNSTYYLSIDGQEWGPYGITELKSMVPTGQVTAETLVWKEGMADWAAAGTVRELRTLFTDRGASGSRGQAQPAAATEFSTGRRAGAAALNPILGLGSYTMGDVAGGLIITALEGATIGMVFWELSLGKDDGAYLAPGTLVFVTGGLAVVFGVIRPFLYHRTPSTKKTAALMDGLDIGLVQAADTPRSVGKTAPGVRISYSFQF
jgi:hypothetical protein